MLWLLTVVLVANTNGRLAIPALAGLLVMYVTEHETYCLCLMMLKWVLLLLVNGFMWSILNRQFSYTTNATLLLLTVHYTARSATLYNIVSSNYNQKTPSHEGTDSLHCNQLLARHECSGLSTRGQSNLTKSASRGPIPRLGVTPGGRKLYHWIPGVGFSISVP